MRNTTVGSSPTGRRDSCPSCDSERIEYEFAVHDTAITRCVDCEMLFCKNACAASPAPNGNRAARIRDRISHLRASVDARLDSVLVIADDLPLSEVLDGDLQTVAQLESGRLAPGSYDAAVCVDVLDRVADPAEFLERLREVLTPGAPVSVTVNSVDSTAARHARAGWRGFRGGAVRFYNVDSLQNTLIRSGFRDPRSYVDGTIRRQSLRLRGAARVARALGLVGAALRAQGRAALIDEAVTMICRRGDPIERYRLSVIVPVYNEERTFRELMTKLLAKTIEGVDIDVTIVESNSTDSSRAEVLRFESHPRVTVILQDRPSGKGNAVRAGLAHATGDIILFQDADLEYEIDDYDDLVRPIVAYQRNFVIGSRHGRSGSAWKIRDFTGAPVLSQVFNLGHLLFLGLLNSIYGQTLADPFSMFKVFRRDCLSGLTFECNRFDFDFEIVIKLLRKGYRPLEIPVNYQSRSIAEGKKVTMVRDPMTWLRALVRFRTSPLYAPASGVVRRP